MLEINLLLHRVNPAMDNNGSTRNSSKRRDWIDLRLEERPHLKWHSREFSVLVYSSKFVISGWGPGHC